MSSNADHYEREVENRVARKLAEADARLEELYSNPPPDLIARMRYLRAAAERRLHGGRTDV